MCLGIERKFLGSCLIRTLEIRESLGVEAQVIVGLTKGKEEQVLIVLWKVFAFQQLLEFINLGIAQFNLEDHGEVVVRFYIIWIYRQGTALGRVSNHARYFRGNRLTIPSLINIGSAAISQLPANIGHGNAIRALLPASPRTMIPAALSALIKNGM